MGQDALICPGRPQYRQRFWRMCLSLSSPLRCVKPICMGSVSGGAVAVRAEAKEGQGCHRERRRLSRRIARSMNCSRILPSSWRASSDCSSG